VTSPLPGPQPSAGWAVRPIRDDEAEQARALLVAADRGPRVADAERFRELLARSQRALVVVEPTPSGDRVIGFLRALTDGPTNGCISMVVVAEDRR